MTQESLRPHVKHTRRLQQRRHELEINRHVHWHLALIQQGHCEARRPIDAVAHEITRPNLLLAEFRDAGASLAVGVLVDLNRHAVLQNLDGAWRHFAEVVAHDERGGEDALLVGQVARTFTSIADMIFIIVGININTNNTTKTAAEAEATHPYRHLRPSLVIADAIVADEQHIGVVPVAGRSELLQVLAIVAEVIYDALLIQR